MKTWLVLLLAFVTLPQISLAGDNPISLSGEFFFLSYTSSGDLHNTYSKTDYGFLGEVTYPITLSLRAEGMAALGLTNDFQFFGGGLTYEFVPASVEKSNEGEAVQIDSYRKWRPYIGVDVGMNTVDTDVDVSRIHAIVTENLFGMMLRAGIRYAIDPTWLVTGSGFMIYGVSSDVTATTFGATIGVTLNLF